MEYKPIILFFALLILFWWISSEEEIKVDDITPSKEPKTQKGLKLKATATDGDNTVMVSTNDGEIKKSSNVAKIDALKTELTGSLKIGNWTIEEQSDGNLVFYKGTKDTTSEQSPYFQISGVDGNIWLHSKALGNPRGWLTTNLSGVVRKGATYFLKNIAHNIPAGAVPEAYVSYLDNPVAHQTSILNLDVGGGGGTPGKSYGAAKFKLVDS